MAKFKKGDRVYLLSDYDSAGTIRVSEWIVGSWGKRQAHLTSAAGNLQARIYTDPAQISGVSDGHGNYVAAQRVLPVDGTDVEAIALDMASALLAARRSHAEYVVNLPAYATQTVEHRTRDLHEPRVLHA